MKKNQKILKTSASGVALAGTSFMLGFSLIELLVVVAIIGILAAIGMVGYGRYTETAKRGAVEANARAIASALTVADSTKVCVDQQPIDTRVSYGADAALACAKTIWDNANMTNPYDDDKDTNKSKDNVTNFTCDSAGPGKIKIAGIGTGGTITITACELLTDADTASDEASPTTIKVTNFK